MKSTDTQIAIFADHRAAELAAKEVIAANFAKKHLNNVDNGYRTDDKVASFYNTGDRVKLWGTRGAFGGGLCGAFLGGLFIAIPVVVGHVIVLGYLVGVAIAAVQGAVVVGGLRYGRWCQGRNRLRTVGYLNISTIFALSQPDTSGNTIDNRDRQCTSANSECRPSELTSVRP